MTRIRTYLAIGAAALAVPAAIAGCGGDSESDVDPQTVIDETFANGETVSSGDLSLTLGGSAEGEQGGSFEATLAGPFQGDPENPNALPQLDWTGSISGESGGQSISFEGAVVVTEDNAYVEYGGHAYEVGTEIFGQLKQMTEEAAAQQSETEGLSLAEAFTRSCEARLEAAGGDPAACHIDFDELARRPDSSEGTEDIEGIETTTSRATSTSTRCSTTWSSSPSRCRAPSRHRVDRGAARSRSPTRSPRPASTSTRRRRPQPRELDFEPVHRSDPIRRRAEASGVTGRSTSASRCASGRQRGADDRGAEPTRSRSRACSAVRGRSELAWRARRPQGRLAGLGAGSGGSAVPGGGSGDADAYLDCIAEATTPAAAQRLRRPALDRTARTSWAVGPRHRAGAPVSGVLAREVPPQRPGLALPADAVHPRWRWCSSSPTRTPVLIFFVAALGIVPTAALMGLATEELAARVGPGHRRPAQRHLRQRAGADHRPVRPQRGAAGGGQGLDRRLDHRQHPAGARRLDADRRAQAPAPDASTHRPRRSSRRCCSWPPGRW